VADDGLLTPLLGAQSTSDTRLMMMMIMMIENEDEDEDDEDEDADDDDDDDDTCARSRSFSKTGVIAASGFLPASIVARAQSSSVVS
jgi:hypothetical protein